MGGPIYIGTTEINEVGELKLGGSNVLAAYVGDVKVFPLTTTTTTTTTTSTTTTTTTAAPTTTSTTTTTTTEAPVTTTSTTTTTTTEAPVTTTSTTTTTTTEAPTTTTTSTTTTTTTCYDCYEYTINVISGPVSAQYTECGGGTATIGNITEQSIIGCDGARQGSVIITSGSANVVQGNYCTGTCPPPTTTTSTTTTTTTATPTTSTTTTTTTIPVYSYCTGYNASDCCVAITDFTNNCYL